MMPFEVGILHKQKTFFILTWGGAGLSCLCQGEDFRDAMLEILWQCVNQQQLPLFRAF